VKAYLAGPMSGIPEFNYPAFHAEAATLRAKGYAVFSPAEIDIVYHGKDISRGNASGCILRAKEEHGFDRKKALWRDLEQIFWADEHRGVDIVFMMPGWEKSTGATLEHAAAKALGLEIRYL